MIWSDRKILKRIVKQNLIYPTDEALINPASINVRMGNTFLVPVLDQEVMLGTKVKYEKFTLRDNQYFTLEPYQFCLGVTMEFLQMPQRVAAFVQGRSSIGRIGLTVQNAGFIDPGFHGTITLELVNESPCPINIPVGYPVAQIVYFDCSRVGIPYCGKYNNQIDATESRMEQDVKKYGKLIKLFNIGDGKVKAGEEYGKTNIVRGDNE